jgi:hypothetical protein
LHLRRRSGLRGFDFEDVDAEWVPEFLGDRKFSLSVTLLYVVMANAWIAGVFCPGLQDDEIV